MLKGFSALFRKDIFRRSYFLSYNSFNVKLHDFILFYNFICWLLPVIKVPFTLRAENKNV